MNRVRTVATPRVAGREVAQAVVTAAGGMLAALILPGWILPLFLVMFGVSLWRHLRQSPPLADQIRRAYQDRQGAAGRHATYRVTPMGGPEDDQRQG